MGRPFVLGEYARFQPMSPTLDSPDQTEFVAQEFRRMTLKNGALMQREFSRCTFIKCAFVETDFHGSVFHDCIFRDCDLSLIKVKNCAFTNTRFEDSKVIGINWTDTTWEKAKRIAPKPVHFVGCAINYSVFLGLNMREIEIVQCVAKGVSFEEADMSKTNCTFTDFTSARFHHTNLTEADFTGATHYAIVAGLNTLKKTKFSLPEAMALLDGLDIVLTDPKTNSPVELE